MAEQTVTVVAVARDGAHNFSKELVSEIVLLEGLGVEGDAHCGKTVKHRSRVMVDPSQPNLRQVHLIASELFNELQEHGFEIAPAGLGENITTSGIDLINLPRGAFLEFGNEAEVEITGLRNPCKQIEAFRAGLLKEMVEPRADAPPILKTGVMAVVRKGGTVKKGDAIDVILPPKPHEALQRV
ncbi:MOSC domain-containing protein [Altererythrobacter sp. MF3-039]|uniref:MOSC domain-containing protein n=1 Tax=Altererythrobacter sp. MF3-039 TaxID=3252901 RepID=UPI00390C67FF